MYPQSGTIEWPWPWGGIEYPGPQYSDPPTFFPIYTLPESFDMGPIREGILKFRAARELRRLGHDTDDIEFAFRMMPGAVGAAVKEAKAEEGVAALGDGTLIAAFLEWLKSDQGKAVLAALVKILLAALGV